MSLKLLVIGGTGFFGKSILDSFVRGRLKKFQISELIILSRSTDKFQINYPEFVLSNIKYVNGDIAILNSLPEADIIIHAATSSKQKDYINDSFREKQNTELGVSNYIKLARKFHKNSKIVYCSSGAVYGNQPRDVLNVAEDFPFQNLEDMPSIKRDYSLSKRQAEKLIIKSGEEGLFVSIARCFAFYGKYLPEDGHFAYASFLKFAKSGIDITINSDHEVIRSYMHADDLVDGLIKIALTANQSCPIYNLGSDVPISIFSLAKNIANKYNVNVITKKNIDFAIIDRYVPDTSRYKNIR